MSRRPNSWQLCKMGHGFCCDTWLVLFLILVCMFTHKVLLNS